MIIEVKRNIVAGKFTGSFEEILPPPEGKLMLPLAKVEGDVHVAGEYEIFDDDSVEVKLTLSYKLRGECSYCLEPAASAVKYSYDALFVPDRDDADNYYYDGVKLDTRRAVEDAFVFSQPEVLLCADCARQNAQNSKN